MLIYKIDIQRLRESEGDAQLDAFNGLLGAYRLDGHVLGRELMTVSTKTQFEAYLLVPAADAFDQSFQNEWIEKQLDHLQLANLSEPKFSELGSDLSEPDGCKCVNPSCLILFTTYLQLQSPLRCGDCFNPIPLYHFPRFKSGEFVEVISWMDDFKACDSLFMNSTTGERFAYREMSKINSSLTRQGRRICDHFEENTGKAVYYYLHKYYGRSYVSELARQCPGCGGAWHVAEKWHNLFDFRCDSCRLISNLSWALA